MKKLCFAAVCCLFSVAAKAQVPTINIINTKPVDVYVMFFGDNACGTSFTSNVIAIPSGFAVGGLTPASYTWSGGTPTYFTGVRVYEGNPSTCPVGFVDIGDGCTGMPPSLVQPYLDAFCTPQGAGPNNWNSAPWVFADLHLHP